MVKDLFNCFKNNRFKSIVDKYHVLFSTNRPVGIKIGGNPMDNSECKKLLGVKIDVNLHFNDHISELCKKASRKISALGRVTPFMGLRKKNINKCFFSPQSSGTAYSFGCVIVVVIMGK